MSNEEHIRTVLEMMSIIDKNDNDVQIKLFPKIMIYLITCKKINYIKNIIFFI